MKSSFTFAARDHGITTRVRHLTAGPEYAPDRS